MPTRAIKSKRINIAEKINFLENLIIIRKLENFIKTCGVAGYRQNKKQKETKIKNSRKNIVSKLLHFKNVLYCPRTGTRWCIK